MFGTDGWCIFDHDPAVDRWATAARKAGRLVVSDPSMRKAWLQCEGTWFVGVDALPNDSTGAICNVPFPERLNACFPEPKHPAQLSIIYPGYPKPRFGETEAAFQYRFKRDAAHVDGILGLGTPKRRFVKEPHAYILGIPLTPCGNGASPMVVWRGSHRIMRDAFAARFDGIDPIEWSNVDVTDAYINARKKVFTTCERVLIEVGVGHAYALHPLCLHGVAPWSDGATSPTDGRMIAYFRPMLSHMKDWLRDCD
jgi:hypothetical protein